MRFSSYPNGRKQYAEVNNTKANMLNTTIVLPQGSVLGSLLYIIYVNDFLCKEVILYADETTFRVSNKSTKEVVRQSNQKLENTFQLTVNNLILKTRRKQFHKFPVSKSEIGKQIIVNVRWKND